MGRNVAIALRSKLEVRDPKLLHPMYFEADELFRLNERLYKSNQVQVYSTILPSDPGLRLEVREATLEDRDIPKRGIFGFAQYDPATGAPLDRKAEVLHRPGHGAPRLEDVPIFYFPYLAGDIEDPLGPLESVTFNASGAYGFYLATTWDIFDLIGLEQPDGTRWQLMLDYLSKRGPALGTDFDFSRPRPVRHPEQVRRPPHGLGHVRHRRGRPRRRPRRASSSSIP